MNKAAAALMSLRPVLSLKELAHYWAPELGLDIQWLLERLLEAIGSGLFDAILSPDGSAARGVLLIDKDSGSYGTTDATRYRKLFADVAAQGHDLGLARCILINNHMIGLTREAVWHFCQLYGLACPSFWPMPPIAKRGRDSRLMPSPQRRHEIVAFLLNTPPKSTTAPEMERAVMRKFNVPRSIARELIGELPSDQKLSRGEKRRRSAS